MGPDCERRRAGYPAEPSNCLSSLAFLPGAVLLAARARRPGTADPWSDRLAALAMAANGVGSAAYHARYGRVTRWMHDCAITAILWLVGTGNADRPIRRGVEIAGLLAAATTHAARPEKGPFLQALAALAVLKGWICPPEGDRGLSPWSWRRRVAGTAMLALGGGCYLAGRSRSRWCNPDSRLQFHAMWHVLAAAGLTVLADDVSARRRV